MRMKENKKVYAILLLLSLICSSYIIVHYWMNTEVADLTDLPMDVFIALFGYVFIQIGKRQWFSARNWWDWLYYIGLTTAVLPTFFATAENAASYSIAAQIGSFFLLLPVVIDGKSLFNDAK